MLPPEYVAGLFDGEGMVSLVYVAGRKWKSDPTKNIGALKFVVGMSNTFKPVLEQVQAAFGGDLNINNAVKKQPHHKQVWAWKITGRDKAIRFLLTIQPHVIIKAEQVTLGLSYLETVGTLGQRISQDNWDKRVSIFQKLREANRKGYERVSLELPLKVREGLKPKSFYSSIELEAKMQKMRDTIAHVCAENPSLQALRARKYRAGKRLQKVAITALRT